MPAHTITPTNLIGRTTTTPSTIAATTTTARCTDCATTRPDPRRKAEGPCAMAGPWKTLMPTDCGRLSSERATARIFHDLQGIRQAADRAYQTGWKAEKTAKAELNLGNLIANLDGLATVMGRPIRKKFALVGGVREDRQDDRQLSQGRRDQRRTGEEAGPSSWRSSRARPSWRPSEASSSSCCLGGSRRDSRVLEEQPVAPPPPRAPSVEVSMGDTAAPLGPPSPPPRAPCPERPPRHR